MSVSILGKRYARALVGLAADAAAVDRMAKDLKDFAASWEDSRNLRAMFENPSVAQATRANILRDIAAQTGMQDSVRDLLLLLSDRQRLRHVGEVADAFAEIAEARSGKVRAEVTTASALPQSYFAELERILREVTGKQVVLASRVDPTLIGGVVTRIGDRVFDGSLKSRLSELKEELLAE
jgi:F-type H+-transporting ATPase subunit delta